MRASAFCRYWLGWLLLILSGCSSAYVEGSFDGLSFKPDRTQMAVLNVYPNDTPLRSDQRSPQEESAQTLTLLFSGARFNTMTDWSRADAATRAELAQSWSLHDGLLLERIPLERVKTGEVIDVEMDESGRMGAGDFSAWWVVALPDDAQIAKQGIGAKSEVQIRFERVNLERGGLLEGRIELKRSRAERQTEGEVATGEITLHFSVALMPEALGESNLRLARPIFRCAADLGPTRAGACASRKVHESLRTESTLTAPEDEEEPSASD